MICDKIGKGAKQARKRSLTPDRARQIVERAVAELLEETGDALPYSTTREFFKSWLVEKENEGASSTLARYKGIVDRFLEFLDHKADKSLSHVTVEDIAAFRDSISDTVSSGTTNTYLKVLRVVFTRAMRRELIAKNPALLVSKLSTRDRHERRAFKLEELKKLLEVADAEWRTMILMGIYTGQRLGDIAALDWGNIDLQRSEITLTTQKTGRTQIIPLAKPLLKHLEGIAGSDVPDAPLCPSLVGNGPSWLSNQFYDLMTKAKLVPARTHQKAKEGRDKRRTLHALSFHALRHTATSLLKNAGVSDAIARDIIGHESAAISKSYTHIDEATKRKAIGKMTDVTK